MPRILYLDDELIYHKMLIHALQPLGYQVEVAHNGLEGLKAAKTLHPDLIITDVQMPDINGYEVTRRLRRDPEFAHTPILVLSSQAGLQDKLKSFESGADDHLTKPFEPAELAARVGVFLRRAEAAKAAQILAPQPQEKAHLIAIHSLRGGVGCSSLAVNLAIGLSGLWESPTLLLDLVLTAGQVALMLNSTLKRTWADLAHIPSAELDFEVLQSIIAQHDTGMQVIAAPTYPTEGEMLTGDILAAALKLAQARYTYLVADLPHDFSEIALQTLDAADMLVMLLAPDLSSIRAGAAALDTYTKLNYSEAKIKLVLNTTYPIPHYGLAREKIEAALSFPITCVIPYTPEKFVNAINLGQPLLTHQPTEPAAGVIEDLAYYLSRERHKKNRPAVPSLAWKRVYKRHTERTK